MERVRVTQRARSASGRRANRRSGCVRGRTFVSKPIWASLFFARRRCCVGRKARGSVTIHVRRHGANSSGRSQTDLHVVATSKVPLQDACGRFVSRWPARVSIMFCPHRDRLHSLHEFTDLATAKKFKASISAGHLCGVELVGGGSWRSPSSFFFLVSAALELPLASPLRLARTAVDFIPS